MSTTARRWYAGAGAALGLAGLNALGACDGGATSAEAPPAGDERPTGAAGSAGGGAPVGGSSGSSGFGGGAGGGAGAACTASTDVADEPDDEGVDSNCDGADGIVARDVYVDGDPLVGADTGDGTPVRPLRTPAAALALAKGRGGRVLLRSGIYDVERLDVAGPWALFGGYGPGFRGAPRADKTTLQAPTAAGVLVEAEGAVELHHLTVRGASVAAGEATRTAHGLRLAVGEARLDDVTIEAGDGLAGEAGETGALGAAGVTGRPGNSGNLPHDGQPACGGQAMPGFALGSRAGQANADGSAAGQWGAHVPAQDGGPGRNGRDGANAAASPKVTLEGLLAWSNGKNGSGNGDAGYGGPGGGSPSGAVVMGTCSYFGIAGGWGGSGGCPGGGGQGGVSGGGSVAVMLLAGELKLTRSLLRTGLGGDGGDGGDGGEGGEGGLGGKPGIFSVSGHACLLNAGVSTSCPPDDFHVDCAGYGGQGGKGGRGGRGGGGVGGWTLGIVTARGASVDVDAATQIDLGGPGIGGRGEGGLRAANGQKRATLDLEAASEG